MSEFGVRLCEFVYGGHRCDSTDTRGYDIDDEKVWLCIRHRSWLPALGKRLIDGRDAGGG